MFTKKEQFWVERLTIKRVFGNKLTDNYKRATLYFSLSVLPIMKHKYAFIHCAEFYFILTSKRFKPASFRSLTSSGGTWAFNGKYKLERVLSLCGSIPILLLELPPATTHC
jgi:hypothetical protein